MLNWLFRPFLRFLTKEKDPYPFPYIWFYKTKSMGHHFYCWTIFYSETKTDASGSLWLDSAPLDLKLSKIEVLPRDTWDNIEAIQNKLDRGYNLYYPIEVLLKRF